MSGSRALPRLLRPRPRLVAVRRRIAHQTHPRRSPLALLASDLRLPMRHSARVQPYAPLPRTRSSSLEGFPQTAWIAQGSRLRSEGPLPVGPCPAANPGSPPGPTRPLQLPQMVIPWEFPTRANSVPHLRRRLALLAPLRWQATIRLQPSTRESLLPVAERRRRVGSPPQSAPTAAVPLVLSASLLPTRATRECPPTWQARPRSLLRRPGQE